ncbi:MAG: hypothetical protein RSF70_09825 [Ruthenibacterium sp.]
MNDEYDYDRRVCECGHEIEDGERFAVSRGTDHIICCEDCADFNIK